MGSLSGVAEWGRSVRSLSEGTEGLVSCHSCYMLSLGVHLHAAFTNDCTQHVHTNDCTQHVHTNDCTHHVPQMTVLNMFIQMTVLNMFTQMTVLNMFTQMTVLNMFTQMTVLNMFVSLRPTGWGVTHKRHCFKYLPHMVG